MEHEQRQQKQTVSSEKPSQLVPKNSGISLQDNRPQSTIQKKANNTGLPNQLKSGIENLSGHSMDDVKVHYNSSKPAQLNAHAYAQGTDIHIASGQEKHLPHEAWHVVQQKQGRVRPTMQLKAKVNINDDKSLEKEADVMGAKALNTGVDLKVPVQRKLSGSNIVVQRVSIGDWMTQNTTLDFQAKHVAYSREPAVNKAKTVRQGGVGTSTVLVINNTQQRDIFRGLVLQPNQTYFLNDVHFVSAGVINWRRGFGTVTVHTNQAGKIYHLHASQITSEIAHGAVGVGQHIKF